MNNRSQRNSEPKKQRATLYALVEKQNKDRRNDSDQQSDSEWIPLGVVWETRDGNTWTGVLRSLPLAWLHSPDFRIAVRFEEGKNR